MITRLVAMAALVVVTGCSPAERQEADAPPASEATTTAVPTTDPKPSQPRPRVGECRALGLKAAVAPTSSVKPRPCTKGHTAETFHVGRLDLSAGDRELPVDSRSVQDAVKTACTSRLPRHLGIEPRSVRLTMAQPVWFTPTVADTHAGAEWFRCDVVVVAAPARLLLLPRRTAGIGDSSAVAMCGTAEPGTLAFERVVCSRRHTWRAVSTVDLAGEEVPSAAAASARMEPACRDAARARAADPLDFTWSEERPTKKQWEAGQRYGICWVPTAG